MWPLVACLLAAAPQPAAARAYAEGLKKLSAKEPWAARVSFSKALELNPGFARARYARAAAEAPEFGTQSCAGSNETSEPRCSPPSTLLEDCAWLRENAATDAEAKKLLAGLPYDPAFDLWTINSPDLRAALGLPLPAAMRPIDRLLERKGRWFFFGSPSCSYPEMTLSFSRNGQVGLRVSHRCNLLPDEKPRSTQGNWQVFPDGQVVLHFPELEGRTPLSDLWLPERTRVVFDAERQQFSLTTPSPPTPENFGDFYNTVKP